MLRNSLSEISWVILSKGGWTAVSRLVLNKGFYFTGRSIPSLDRTGISFAASDGSINPSVFTGEYWSIFFMTTFLPHTGRIMRTCHYLFLYQTPGGCFASTRNFFRINYSALCPSCSGTGCHRIATLRVLPRACKGYLVSGLEGQTVLGKGLKH